MAGVCIANSQKLVRTGHVKLFSAVGGSFSLPAFESVKGDGTLFFCTH